MQIDESTVNKLAVLARLEFDAETKNSRLGFIVSFLLHKDQHFRAISSQARNFPKIVSLYLEKTHNVSYAVFKNLFLNGESFQT